MESFQKITHMIQGARAWLDRAEESYQSANPIRGELDLHLAQAEIQRACETSRQLMNNVSVMDFSKKREPAPTWARYYSLGAVASIIGMMLWMGFWVAAYSDGSEKRARTLVGASIWNHSMRLEAMVSQDPTSEEPASVSDTAVKNDQAVRTQGTAQARHIETSKDKGRTYRRPVNTKPRVYTASVDERSSLYDYELPESNDQQWHAVSVSTWGEEQIVREAVPSFSNR